jgi:hypothetical protein
MLVPVPAMEQDFERGSLHHFVRPAPHGAHPGIFVLLTEENGVGRWRIIPDFTPRHCPTPFDEDPDFFTPVGKIGFVWRSLRLELKIGRATSPCRCFQGILHFKGQDGFMTTGKRAVLQLFGETDVPAHWLLSGLTKDSLWQVPWGSVPRISGTT